MLTSNFHKRFKQQTLPELMPGPDYLRVDTMNGTHDKIARPDGSSDNYLVTNAFADWFNDPAARKAVHCAETVLHDALQGAEDDFLDSLK